MNSLLVLMLLVATFQCAKAAVATEKVEPTIREPNRCIRASDRLNMAIGQTKFREGCSKVSCRTSNGQLFIDEESCGVVVSTPECRRDEDKSKNYPDCCPNVTC